jgi:glucose-1-phosphate thymidylyltransferase
MKGVILAGGFGTRLGPFTKRLNKGMAPIYTPNGAIPQLLFPLKTLVDSGITEIMIITSRDHCGHIVELLGDGTEYGCSLTYRIQEMDRPVVGIAQALGLAQSFCSSSNSFAVVLGDNFYEHSFRKEFEKFDMDSKTDQSIASVFLKGVHDPERFGVVTFDGNKITKITEKPSKPESDLAVTGLYLYTPHVFSILPTLVPSRRKELEITDVNNWYVNNCKMNYYLLADTYWHDMGTPEAAKEVCDFLWKKGSM